jgi:hypothetical protein
VSNLEASNTRAIIDVEDSQVGSISNLTGNNIGGVGYGAHAILITNCDAIQITGIAVKFDPAYENPGSDPDRNPRAIYFASASNNVTVSDVNVICQTPLVSVGYGIYYRGDSTSKGNSVKNINVVGLSATGVRGVRATGAGLYVNNISTVDCANVAQLDPSTSGVTIQYQSLAQTGLTSSAIIDANTNKVIVDGTLNGSWIPVLNGESGGSENTYSTQLGRFTRIGSLVYLVFNIQLTTLNSTGNLRISGLPYNPMDTTTAPGNGFECVALLNTNSVTLTAPMVGFASSLDNNIRLSQKLATGYGPSAAGPGRITASMFTNTTFFRMSGWYMTADAM